MTTSVSLQQPQATAHDDAIAHSPVIGDPLCRRLVIAFTAVGALLRLIQYLHNNSYWNDEAAIVMNLLHRDFAALLKPLDFSQAAPILFLWLHRALIQLGGSSEYLLRAPSLLMGLTSLPLFALLAWRNLTPVAAVGAVGFFAFNDRIIPHVCEVKQYSGDLFFSVLLLFIAFGTRKPALPQRRLALAAAFASLSVWFSFPSALVFGGVALALMPAILRTPRAWPWLLCLLAPIISAAFLAKLALAAPRDDYLNKFWQDEFADLSIRFPIWLGKMFFELANYPFASLGVLVLAIAAAGAIAMRPSRARSLLHAFAGTLLLAIIAAALHLYPFGGQRVTLYLLPMLFLLLGAGAGWFTPQAHDRWQQIAWLAPAGLFGLAVVQCAIHTVKPENRSTIRPVVAFVQAHRTPDEAIYLAGGMHMPQPRISGRNVEFLCYWQGSEDGITRRMIPPQEIPQPRFWFVYSIISTEKMSRVSGLIQDLDALFDRRSEFKKGAAGAILFERRPAKSP